MEIRTQEDLIQYRNKVLHALEMSSTIASVISQIFCKEREDYDLKSSPLKELFKALEKCREDTAGYVPDEIRTSLEQLKSQNCNLPSAINESRSDYFNVDIASDFILVFSGLLDESYWVLDKPYRNKAYFLQSSTEQQKAWVSRTLAKANAVISEERNLDWSDSRVLPVKIVQINYHDFMLRIQRVVRSEIAAILHCFPKEIEQTKPVEIEEYTAGQLINDLRDYESGMAHSDRFNKKREGQSATKGSAASNNAIPASRYRSDAGRVWKRISKDAIDLLRPICETQGVFDAKTMDRLRGELCISLGVGESVVNAMSLGAFVKNLRQRMFASNRRSTSSPDTGISKDGSQIIAEESTGQIQTNSRQKKISEKKPRSKELQSYLNHLEVNKLENSIEVARAFVFNSEANQKPESLQRQAKRYLE